ncbi:hypothetical protein BDR07DRAFT_1493927 [Suillus spraguei]|nr:hypothetical protein BDR07DRAFT_1493927 [Suillus spraguei]
MAASLAIALRIFLEEGPFNDADTSGSDRFYGIDNQWSNIVDLVKDKAEYHSLKKVEKEMLIKEFDLVKASASHHPPTITTRSHAAECAHIFQFVKEEDIVQLATEFESTILANGAVLSELTSDAKASVKFTHYEDHVVQHYLIKLVGWAHPQWVNPSDLKGGIDALKKAAMALSLGMCHFFKITHEEVKEQWCHIAAGEKLTPEFEPPLPLNDIPPSCHIPYIQV